MVGMITDVGNVRKINEDYLSYSLEGKNAIYVVADGMGGHNAGEVASKMTVETIIESIKNKDAKATKEDLINAINKANERVYQYSLSSSNLSGMGTTVTACLIDDKKAWIANVGDSSCYIIKNDNIYKITKDHSLVQELVDDGSITEKEALTHPNKNIITRAIGTYSEVETDIYELDLTEGIEHIILCTDGLTNEVSKEEIYNAVKEHKDYMSICENLINLAKQRSARDNISFMIFGGDYYDWNCSR